MLRHSWAISGEAAFACGPPLAALEINQAVKWYFFAVAALAFAATRRKDQSAIAHY
jgi:hypothetical protein